MFPRTVLTVHSPALSYSRVVEVDPESNKTVWDYVGDPPEQFLQTLANYCAANECTLP
jgi:hypothetical protein